jgi:ankyrin repeat protein
MNEQTHLFAAVFKGRSHITHELLERGSDVNKVDNALLTPINLAAYSGFAEGVKMLIAAGADLSRKDRLGNTPLHDIAASGNFMSKRFQQGEKAEEWGEYFISWSGFPLFFL